MLQRGLEQLSAEEQATLALHAALESNSGSKTKEAFLRLKNATAEAKQASIGLTVELQEAIRGTEAAVEKRFAQLMAEWEEALQRQEELREAERQQRCAEVEIQLLEMAVEFEAGLCHSMVEVAVFVAPHLAARAPHAASKGLGLPSARERTGPAPRILLRDCGLGARLDQTSSILLRLTAQV